MEINRAIVDLRPLPPQRCTELGIALARRWYAQLVFIYVLAVLPWVLVATALGIYYPQSVFVMILAIWWLKPFAELAALKWCSHALFAEPVTATHAVGFAWRSFPRLWLNYLGVFRLAPARGIGLCVVFLERAGIGKGRQRVQLLKGSHSALPALTLIGVHIEFILAVGGAMLLLSVLPVETPLTESFKQDWSTALSDYFNGGFYYTTTLIAAIAFSPFYVCASFIHYINRRSQLEAWDIQQAFNALEQRAAQLNSARGPRVQSPALAILLLLLCAGTAAPPAAIAANAAPDAKRVITEVIAQEQFGYYSEKPHLSWREDKPAAKQAQDWPLLKAIAAGLYAVIQSPYLKPALWIFVLSLALIVAARYRSQFVQFLRFFIQLRSPSAMSPLPSASRVAVATENDTFEAARKAMLSGDRRLALGRCLGAVLISLKQQHQIDFRSSDTERQCRNKSVTCLSAKEIEAFDELLSVWYKHAYSAASVAELYCDSVLKKCEAHFGRQQP